MKADIGRDTFNPAKRFLRVVMQQGRVQVASDWNERDALVYQAIRTLAADLIGPWGGSPGAFRVDAISGVRGDFQLGPGHYWVDGILCDNPTVPNASVTYLDQPYYIVPDAEKLSGPEPGQSSADYLVYLDIWERLVTAAEDEDIREVALGGPDTAARTEVVWQVRAAQFDRAGLDGTNCDNMLDRWPDLLERVHSSDRGRLRARAKTPNDHLDHPCAIDPRAAYRGEENALFRVEIHTPGLAGTATFKWSSSNAADSFPVERFGGDLVQLTTLGRDARSTLEAGDWVELEYDTYILQQRAEPLFKVRSVDYLDLSVKLDRAPTPIEPSQHPRLRRWDQKATSARPLEPDGTIKVTETSDPDGAWIELSDDGVQVQFVTTTPTSPVGSLARYRTGDFWLIPARTALRDVIWPQETSPPDRRVPAARSPHGVDHHYAPLAWIAVAGDDTVTVVERFVRTLTPLAECVPDAGET